MRYLVLTKYLNVPQTPPPAQLWADLNALAKEGNPAVKLTDTQGLKPSATGSRVTLRGGQSTAMAGPFSQHQEVASYTFYKAAGLQDVVDMTERFFAVHRDNWPGWEAEADILQVFEPEDYKRASQ